jgi:hypothetical protein
MPSYDSHYYLTREFNGNPIGTEIRVHNWNETSVQISIHGKYEWINANTFKHITEYVVSDYWTNPIGDNRRDGYSEFSVKEKKNGN